MKKKYKLIVLSLIFSLVLGSAQAKLFGAQSFVLENGLEVIVVENHKAPIIKHMVWYKAGGVDEISGKGGSAHLLEHLMFRGTTNVPGHQFNDILEQNGAESNAFTSLDYTAYHQSLDISKLELAMALEADRMQNLNISEQDFNLERDIVYQERMQVIENNPSSAFSESYNQLLWAEHPYARPITGTREEIKNLQLQDVVDFYQKFYTPDNAVLVLAGDIDVATAKNLAQKYYGAVPKRPLGKKANFPELKNISAELKMQLPQINAERLVRTYVVPSYTTDKAATYNLMVLSKYLGDGDTSELYKSLVLDKKLALSVATDYDYSGRSFGRFSISALPADGVSMPTLNQAIDAEIKVALEKFNLDELGKIKHKMLAGLVYLQDNPFEAANSVGTMVALGMSVEEIESHADNLQKVDYREVKTAAKKVFNQSRNIHGFLSPQSGEK